MDWLAVRFDDLGGDDRAGGGALFSGDLQHFTGIAVEPIGVDGADIALEGVRDLSPFTIV